MGVRKVALSSFTFHFQSRLPHFLLHMLKFFNQARHTMLCLSGERRKLFGLHGCSCHPQQAVHKTASTPHPRCLSLLFQTISLSRWKHISLFSPSGLIPHPPIISGTQQRSLNDGLSRKRDIATRSGMVLWVKGDSSSPGQNAVSVLTLLSLSQAAKTQTDTRDTLRTSYSTCSHLQVEMEGGGDTTLRMRL